MVFLAMVGDGSLFGPFFLEDGRLTAAKYMQLLQQYGQNFRTLIWQQDGAPAHRARSSLRFLDQEFGQRMLAQGSLQGHEWAPSSPDLSPLDFSVWSSLKTQVYSAPVPTTILDLKRKIRNAVLNMDQQHVVNAMMAIQRRAQLVINAQGGHFEN